MFFKWNYSYECIMDGEGTGTGTGGGTGSGTGTDDGGSGAGGATPRTFTEDEVKAMLDQEKKNGQEAVRRTIAELENLKKGKETTEKQRQDLQTKIEELSNSLLTKEELAKKALKQQQEESETKISGLTTERDAWQNRFLTTTLYRELSDAANKYGAINPEQVIALLKDRATVVEGSDCDGNPTGVFATRVKIPSKDKDGKDGFLDLTAEEAVKHMRDTIELYGNLFKDTNPGGAGKTGGTSGRKADPASIKSMEEYMKHRSVLKQ